jgi:hypothetical protein
MIAFIDNHRGAYGGHARINGCQGASAKIHGKWFARKPSAEAVFPNCPA